MGYNEMVFIVKESMQVMIRKNQQRFANAKISYVFRGLVGVKNVCLVCAKNSFTQLRKCFCFQLHEEVLCFTVMPDYVGFVTLIRLGLSSMKTQDTK